MNQSCSWRKWDISGVPYEHAIATIIVENFDPYEHISECYHKEIYMKAYSHSFSLRQSPQSGKKYDTILSSNQFQSHNLEEKNI